VVVLIRSGIRIEITAFPDWLDLLLTVVWMVGIINAFNIIDVMDGLAAGVGLIACIWIFVVAILNHDTLVAMMVVALAGSLLGFLRYNFHPASIYLGDAGSLFIGLMLGAMTMIGQYTVVHRVGLFTPLLILGVAVFDTVLVMYVRWLRGIPVFLGSPDHFSLRLRHWRLSVPQVAVFSYVAAFMLGGVALAIMWVPMKVALVLFGATLALGLVAMVLLTRIDMAQSSMQGFRRGTSSTPIREEISEEISMEDVISQR
jgi:UDP-GlcNAc:undecaprenyl-phosphate GlcNAc-1-phosphate transferase